jgi:hypothetical protein
VSETLTDYFVAYFFFVPQRFFFAVFFAVLLPLDFFVEHPHVLHISAPPN